MARTGQEALEAGVLGHMLIDNSIIPKVQKRITDDYKWVSREHLDLWLIITSVYGKGVDVDSIAVKTVLDEGKTEKYQMGFSAGVEHVARILEAAANIPMDTMLDLLLGE